MKDNFVADESTILIPVPKAEELVGAYLNRYDPSAKAGVPAHITPYSGRGANAPMHICRY